MTDFRSKRRWSDLVSAMIVCATLVLLLGGSASLGRAQSQDAFNARTDERVNDLSLRLQRVETGMAWAFGALIANLSAHIVQIYGQRRRRGRDD